MKENTLIFKELEALVDDKGQIKAASNERAAATFTNLISEFDLILACYQEAAGEFMAQVKKVQGKHSHSSAGGLTSISEGFKRVITLMAEHNKCMKQSGLTSSVHPNTRKA